MSTGPTLPEDQLLELLIQLQKTTPEQARAILNAQPEIGYALVPLMAKMGVVNLDVLQKTLASYTGQSTSTPAPPASIPTPVPPSVPAVPTIPTTAHLTQPPYGHHPTPPPVNHTSPISSSVATPGYPAAAGATGYPGYGTQVQNGGGGYVGLGQGQGQYVGQHWNGQQQPQQTVSAPIVGAPATGMLGALGNIPEDQREMIMRVISMTPDQIRSLPLQERAITIQLRATLGLPAE